MLGGRPIQGGMPKWKYLEATSNLEPATLWRADVPNHPRDRKARRGALSGYESRFAGPHRAGCQSEEVVSLAPAIARDLIEVIIQTRQPLREEFDSA